jgi:preprotein translocase subunit SecY
MEERMEKQRSRSRLYALQPLVSRLPEIRAPKYRVILQEKIIFTMLSLMLFLVMAQIPLYGLGGQRVESLFGYYRYVFASHAGTLMELGIGPIVTAGLIMQLLVGGKIIGLDLSKPEDRALFTGVQKFLAIIVGVFMASMYAFGIYPQRFGAELTTRESIFITIELTIGVMAVLYLDELVSKYGFGSGIGLFIVANFSAALFVEAFSPLESWIYPGELSGAIPNLIKTVIVGEGLRDAFFRTELPNMVGLIATLIVLSIIVYAEGIRAEMSVVQRRLGGITASHSIRFLYASVIPVILAGVLFMNVRLFAGILYNRGYTFLGTFDNRGNPTGGVVYYLDSPNGIHQVMADPPRAATYFVALVLLCMGFAWLWINATGMRSRDISEQFERLGISPVGRNAGAIDQVLRRQTMSFALLGGAFVGAVAALADFVGALGGGTGMILAVCILHRLYEEVLREHSWDIEAWREKKVKFKGKVCPVCGSGSFVYSGTFSGWTFYGVHAAQKYLCKNCGYAGPITLELQSEGDIEKLKKYYSKEIKNGIGYSQPTFPPEWIQFWRIITYLLALFVVALILLGIIL